MGFLGPPPENHQKHFFGRWILHTSLIILTFSLWGYVWMPIVKNEKFNGFLSTFQNSMSWIDSKNKRFWTNYKKHVFSHSKNNVSKKYAFWRPRSSNNFIIPVVFQRFSFLKNHRFSEAPTTSRRENVIISLDVWKNTKKRKL